MFAQTVDYERSSKVINAMKEGDFFGLNFIKKHKLTLNEYYVCENVLRDYWKNGVAECFMQKVADVFRHYGFDISIDENNINYIIQ